MSTIKFQLRKNESVARDKYTKNSVVVGKIDGRCEKNDKVCLLGYGE